MTAQLLNVALMLLLTLGFFVALMFFVKYMKNLSPKFSNSIQILGGASVSHKAKVVIVQSDDTKILLGVTDNQINKLHVFDKNEFRKSLDGAKQEVACQE